MKIKTKLRCLQLAHWPCLPKDFVAMSLKYSQRTFRKRANGDQVLFNFWWSSRIKGNNTPKSWMMNHCHLRKMTLQDKKGRTVVGLLRCGRVPVPLDVLI
jgi:hypothetical protein